MTHGDIATRVLRSIALAWAGLMKRDIDGALACISRALTELEGDLTFCRVHADLLDLIVDVAGSITHRGVKDIEDRAVRLRQRAMGAR